MATSLAATTITAHPSQKFQTDVQQIQSIVVTGISSLTEYVNQNLNAHQNEVLNIGIVGSSRQGKSTFINSIRRLKAGDAGAAEVGVNETTKTIQKYKDPCNPNLLYWDLPGCGTSNFPRDQYIKLVKLDTYDFFVIISASSFTENDGWLAKEVAQLGKCFYFVRTHIDKDIKSERDDHPERRQSHVLRAIRKKCLEELDKLDLKLTLKPRIFLVSGRYDYYAKWDFPKLVSSLLNNCSGLKKQAMTMALTANSKQAIQQKVELLRSRIWKVATLSAGVAAIPIPGTSILADSTMLVNEANMYKKQLNLDDGSLDKLAETHSVTRQMIDKKLKLISNFDPMLFTNLTGFITKLLITYAAAEMGEELARMVPIAGWFVAGAISYVTMYKVLHNLLDRMEEASLLLMEYLISENSKLSIAEEEEDVDLPSEISETLETTRREVSLQPVKTVEPLSKSVISAPTPPAEAPKVNFINRVRSLKSRIICCFRR